MAIKHIGRMAKNKRKVVVAYRVVPGEPENAIIVTTENLEAADHDVLMKTVESDAGQSANEFADVMARTRLADGRNMLAAFHTTGKMAKVSTKDVEMTPNTQTVILLSDLNEMIAEQKGVTVADLAVSDGSTTKAAPAVETAPVADTGVLTDEDLAAQYRSQADALFKEAKALREQAEALVPTKKKIAKTKESA